MTDLPTSTAPAAAAHPLVKGRCPSCRGASLFLGSGGYVTCSRLDCPNPTAADQLLHGEQPAPAEDAIARLRALHHDWDADPGHCAHCQDGMGTPLPWPCPTIRTLDAEQPAPAPAATAAASHTYLSTGCLHGHHDYCQSHTGQSGEKTPASCKFCTAPCVCPCHTGTPAPAATQATDDVKVLGVVPMSDGIADIHGGWPRAGQRLTAHQAATAATLPPGSIIRATPREHCGDLMPSWSAGPRTECVLPPNHAGSHADDRGARWRYDPHGTGAPCTCGGRFPAQHLHADTHQPKEQPMPKPACTARIEGPHVIGGGPVHCTREAGHPGNHTGPQTGDGRTLWTDGNAGATPHQASSEGA